MVTLNPGQSVPVKVNPLKPDPNNPTSLVDSDATLSEGSGGSSDVTVFTLVMDTTDPTGASGTLTAVATSDAQATLSWQAKATEKDGVTVNVISGSDQIFVTAAPPPVGVATTLGFSYGVPTSAPSAKRK